MDAEREYSPLLVSECSKIESSGVDVGIKEAYASGHSVENLEVSRGGYGSCYEIEGILDKKGTGVMKEIGTEGNVVSVLCEEVDFIDDDWRVRDFTVFDETLQDDNNSPIYYFKLVLKEP